MQRLEWHCHTKSVLGAHYKTILYHGQSAGKEMANSVVFNFWRNAGSDWISLTEFGSEFQAVTPAVHTVGRISPRARKNGFIDDESECANRQKMNVSEITRKYQGYD